MSLATRCPTCATAFRVVQDQLKVSAGWVRCGRCGEVFNANEGLYDLNDGAAASATPPPPKPPAPPGAALVRQPPTDWTPPESPAARSTAAPGSALRAAARPTPIRSSVEPPPSPFPDHYAPTMPMGLDDVATPGGMVVDELAVPPSSRSPIAPDEEIEALIAATRGGAKPEPALPIRAVFKPEIESDPTVEALLAETADDSPELGQVDLDSSGFDVEEEVPPPPTFVQQADRAARWRRPWVRVLLFLVALGLSGLLAVQVGLAQRDLLAARMPELQPVLADLCRRAGCTIEAPRRIAALAVESSGLARVEGSPLYRLTLALRNRENMPLMLPSVELAITDASGQLVARRVLSPAEVGASGVAIGPGQEQQFQALLSVADRRLAGYTIELFYP